MPRAIAEPVGGIAEPSGRLAEFSRPAGGGFAGAEKNIGTRPNRASGAEWLNRASAAEWLNQGVPSANAPGLRPVLAE